MGEHARLTREMGDAERERFLQCRIALDKLEYVRAAVRSVQDGEPVAVGRLAALCEERYYGGLLPDVRCEKIVVAASEYEALTAELAKLDDADDVCELKA